MILRAKKILGACLKQKKARDGYVCMYEYGKNLLHLTYECACVEHEGNITQMKYIMQIFNSDIKKIYFTE